MVADTQALHYSEGKSGVDQIPPELLIEWGLVFSYGEKKYARNNWLDGMKWDEFYGSVLRHLLAWRLGEDVDPESGLPHLAHALWNVGALRYYQLHGLGEDTRQGRTASFLSTFEQRQAAIQRSGDCGTVMFTKNGLRHVCTRQAHDSSVAAADAHYWVEDGEEYEQRCCDGEEPFASTCCEQDDD